MSAGMAIFNQRTHGGASLAPARAKILGKQAAGVQLGNEEKVDVLQRFAASCIVDRPR